MNKIIAVVLLALLALSVCTPAFAATDVLITGSDDLIIYLIDTRLMTFDFGNGESYGLQCPIIIENRYDHPIAFRAYNCYVDGVEATMATPAKTDTGVHDKLFTFMPEDDRNPGYLFTADTITFDLDVENFNTDEVLFTEHVTIEGGLPGLENIELPEGVVVAAPEAEAPKAQMPSMDAIRSKVATMLPQLPGNASPAQPEAAVEAAPAAASALMLANAQDFRFAIVATDSGSYFEDTNFYRDFYVVMENNTGRTINVDIADGVINGETTKAVDTFYEIGPGAYQDSFYFKVREGGNYERLLNIETVSFTIAVTDCASGEELYSFPVSFSGEIVQALPVGEPETDLSGYEVSSDPAPAATETEFITPESADEMLYSDETPGERENASLLVIDDEDLVVDIIAWEASMTEEGAMVRYYPIIDNRTNTVLEFKLEDVYFDQTMVKGYGIYDVEPGVYDGDCFAFKNTEGGPGYELLDPDWVSFRLVVKDAKTAETIREIPVGFSGDWLDVLPLGNPNA